MSQPPIQWEYKQVLIPGPPDNDETQLNALGIHGWEAVTFAVVTNSNLRIILMKRPKLDWI